jgi:hypothetical protein
MSDILLPQKKFYVVNRKPIISRHAKKAELTNAGFCRKCGRYYKWTVQWLEQFEKPDTEKEDRQTRAMALFMEYKEKHVGHCCADREHRVFIKNNVGQVIYE